MNDAPQTPISGGSALARTLADLGVHDVFALHGGHLDAFLVACAEHGIRLIDTRHEATAGHAADAYARATGGIGVAVITAGPGFTNALTPMVSAYLDAIPTLFIAGAPPLRETEMNPLQGGFDQVAMATPATKWAHRITSPDRIPDLVEKALRIASSGRPGPVFLEVPIDVMFASVGTPMIPVTASPRRFRPAPSQSAVTKMLATLSRAQRPIIIAGGGTILARASEPLRRFVELTGIPVVTNSRAHGILPHDHANYCGGVGSLGGAVAAGNPPDVVMLAGARAGLFTGSRSGGVIPHAATLMQIDTDAGEIGRLRAVDVPVVADCAESFEVLLREAGGVSWPDLTAWRGILQRFRHGLAALFDNAPTETRPGLLHPYHAAKAAMGALDAGTAIVFDGGESSAWCDAHLRAAGPGLFMTNGYLGCLGISQGFAIGSAIAHPDRRVAIFTGDGAVGFNIQEFDTMVRHRLPILTVVMNNACWGMSQHGQDLVFGSNRRSVVALADTNYDQVAVAFGGYGERIDRYDDIVPAVRRALASGLPACINLIIDPDVVHPVTPAMVGNVKAKDEIAIPYYENLPNRK